MRHLIDRWTTTRAERRQAASWAKIAVDRYGSDAARHLRSTLAGEDKVKSRRALRLAIRQVEIKLRARIFIGAGVRGGAEETDAD